MKFAFALYSSKAIARGSGLLFFLNQFTILVMALAV
jgi:ribosomal protein L24E